MTSDGTSPPIPLEVPPGGDVTFDHSRNAWLVGDLMAARTVLRRHDLFSTQGYKVIEPDLSDIRRFITAPPEHHRRLRRVMTQAYAANRMDRVDRVVLRPLAEHLVAALPAAGVVDLQDSFVSPYTAGVMYGLIGLDREAGDRLVAAYRVTDRYFRSKDDRERGSAALRLLRQQAAQICGASAATAPPVSLLGVVRDQRWLDRGLDIDDVVCLMMSLIEAVAVKVHLDLTATALRRVAAMTHIGQDRLVTTGAYVGVAEEAVRLQQGAFLPRIALGTVDLGGTIIPAGDQVFVLLGEANTDRCAFADPQRFNPWRRDRDQMVSFGLGLHRCVGENIAKRIAVRACEELLQRFRLTLEAEQATGFHVQLSPRA